MSPTPEIDSTTQNSIPQIINTPGTPSDEEILPLLPDESQLIQTMLISENEDADFDLTNANILPPLPLHGDYIPHGERVRRDSSVSFSFRPDTAASNRRPSIASSSIHWTGSSILKYNPENGKSTSNFHVEFIPSAATPLEEEPLPIPNNVKPQVMAAISVALASMVIGIASAYSAPAIPSMNEPDSTLRIELDGEEASWIGSLMPLGALFGGIVGAAPVEKLGRKTTILATAFPFILSWILIALASNIWMIYAARTIAGICIGLIGLTLPVYLAETVQPEVRGTLGLLPTTIGNTGILISFVAGKYMDWRNLAYLGAALCIPYMICMTFIPETPRWYISHEKEAAAEKSLQWLRGKGADIRVELHQIKTAHMISKKNDTKFKDIFRKENLKLAFVALGLMFFQQFSGINAVIFYSTAIFEMSGSSIEKYLSTIIVGLVNLGAIFIANVLIDRLGRKILLLLSDVLMIISLTVLATYFYALEYHKELISELGWIPLVCLMSFVVAFSLGFGPVPWLMMGEIFPTSIRGPAAALTTAFNWTCTFFVTKMFPKVVATFGLYTAFYGFAIISVLGIFFIIFKVPETQGQSLEDIERNLARPFRRVSSLANLKPFPMST